MCSEWNRSVDIAGIPVWDCSREDVVAAVAELVARSSNRVVTAYALHVGGLNQLVKGDRDYTEALRGADVVYADGAAVVLLGRAAGAKRIQRAATTDVGLDILSRSADQLGRKVRVSLVGGPPGLAEQAGRVLEELTPTIVVHSSNGFRSDNDELVSEIRASHPDVILVGMGVPVETLWTERVKASLPPSVVVTCGGWFGFLTGQERRAPELMRRLRLEWLHRLILSPRRLAARYITGAVSTGKLLLGQWVGRAAKGYHR